jgi:hypothetical protein
MPATRTAGHIWRPQRIQAATAIPPVNKGSVGCAPALGNMKPTAPAVNMEAKVRNHLRTGSDCGFMARAYDEPAMLVARIRSS